MGGQAPSLCDAYCEVVLQQPCEEGNERGCVFWCNEAIEFGAGYGCRTQGEVFIQCLAEQDPAEFSCDPFYLGYGDLCARRQCEWESCIFREDYPEAYWDCESEPESRPAAREREARACPKRHVLVNFLKCVWTAYLRTLSRRKRDRG